MSRNNLVLQLDSNKDGLYVLDRDTKTSHRMMGYLKSTSAVTSTSYPSWFNATGGYLTSDGEVYDHVYWGSTLEKINGDYWFVRNVLKDQNNEKYLIKPDVSNGQKPRYPTFRLDDGNEYQMTYTISPYSGWDPSYAFMKRIDVKHWEGIRETVKDGSATITYRPMFISPT